MRGTAALKLLAALGLLAGMPVRAAFDPVTPNGGKFKGWARPHYEACQKRVAAVQDGCDIILVGDSITEAWTPERIKRHFGDLRVLNFGIGGDETAHVLWRLENMDVQSLKPKTAVVLIGTNNYQKPGDASPEDIARGVRVVLEKVRALYPDTRIILTSILHGRRKNAADADDVLMETNEIIQGFADGETIIWADVASKMTPAGEGWRETGPDNLHLNDLGYDLWAAEIKPLLAK